MAADDLTCPTCDQSVSPEKFFEIEGKLRSHDAEVERAAAAKFAAKEAAIRKEAAATATAAATAKLAKVEREKKAAEAAAKAAGAETKRLLETQRKMMEQATDERVAAERDRHGAEKATFEAQKATLEGQLADMSRKLASKTAHQLGEPAEVDLFARLKAAFPIDRISRVRKGAKGPDVVIEVVHNETVAGTIILDSKNHSKWSSKFVTKLRADQRAMDAAFAILSSNVYPSNKQVGVAKQPLQVQDGIVVADPSLVVAVVAILRQQVVDHARLRLSSEARSEKADKVYALILSPTWTDWFNEVVRVTNEMSDLEKTDAASYAKTSAKRFTNIASLRAAYEAMAAAISRLINGERAP